MTAPYVTAAQQARAEFTEDVEFLIHAGESLSSICLRFGVRAEAIARRLHRAGRTDLARGFWRMADKERRADR